MIRTVSPIRRQGFTMVEMLVVIGVILFLMTIAVATLSNAIGVARQRATEATILKINGLLQQRVEAFDRAMDKTNLSQNSPPIRNMANAWQSKYSIVPPNNVLEIMVRKQFFQARFPQNFAESPGANLATLPITGVTYVAANHSPVTESAALLYWILTSSEIYGIAPVDDSEFNSSEVRDTDGDGLKEFVDGWGRPLRFYRWPTHLIRPGDGFSVAPGIITSGSSIDLAVVNRTWASGLWSGLPAAPTVPGELDPLARDPDDPTGQMWRWAVNQSSTGPAIAMQNFFGTPQTYHAFLIVSAGPDGILGLDEPCLPVGITETFPGIDAPQGRLAALKDWSSLATNPINDNITNRKR
jgi:prepilin-type N-terminal cleavage/methylation domain-containing protein